MTKKMQDLAAMLITTAQGIENIVKSMKKEDPPSPAVSRTRSSTRPPVTVPVPVTVAEKLPLRDRLQELLSKSPFTTTELAKSLGESIGPIQDVLAELHRTAQVKNLAGTGQKPCWVWRVQGNTLMPDFQELIFQMIHRGVMERESLVILTGAEQKRVEVALKNLQAAGRIVDVRGPGSSNAIWVAHAPSHMKDDGEDPGRVPGMPKVRTPGVRDVTLEPRGKSRDSRLGRKAKSLRHVTGLSAEQIAKIKDGGDDDDGEK